MPTTDLPPVTDALIEEVIATADQATPGRWKLWGMAVLADQDGTSNAATAVPVCETQCGRDGKPRTFDAHHIRLMDPPTAKALALEVRRLRAALSRYNEPESRHDPDIGAALDCLVNLAQAMLVTHARAEKAEGENAELRKEIAFLEAANEHLLEIR